MGADDYLPLNDYEGENDAPNDEPHVQQGGASGPPLAPAADVHTAAAAPNQPGGFSRVPRLDPLSALDLQWSAPYEQGLPGMAHGRREWRGSVLNVMGAWPAAASASEWRSRR